MVGFFFSNEYLICGLISIERLVSGIVVVYNFEEEYVFIVLVFVECVFELLVEGSVEVLDLKVMSLVVFDWWVGGIVDVLDFVDIGWVIFEI